MKLKKNKNRICLKKHQLGGIMKRIKLVIVLAVVMVALVFTPELAAKVVKVTASVTPTSWTGKCPKRFEFVGKITVNRPGVVKYRWIRSDGAGAPVKTLRFRRPGTLNVTSYWQLSSPGTKWEAVEILAPNKMTSNKAVFTLRCRPGLVARPGLVKPATTVRPGLVRPGTLTRNCPDPAAVEIRFRIVRRYSQFRGRIRITGVVKNIGGKAFIAGPNKAKAYLYQEPPGVPCANATGGTIVAQREIRNLAPGATLLVSWERDWNSSSPSEGEFPSCYRLLITYDPDIYMDASKDNDDCNQNNNKKDRSGTEINAMLR
jgi:hypothetical protein